VQIESVQTESVEKSARLKKDPDLERTTSAMHGTVLQAQAGVPDFE
jgi:hypothetical protein